MSNTSRGNVVSLLGKVFERLTVIADPSPQGVRYVTCKCYCGKTKDVIRYNLIYSRTRSCGCMRSELLTSHGGFGTKTYKVWEDMKSRCLNKNNKRYPSYGGRGIKIASEWLDFGVFRADMGEAPEGMSLDRIYNDGGYSKDNCRWVSVKEQQNNMRPSIRVDYNGKSLTMQELGRLSSIGVSVPVLVRRLRDGWSIHDALETPLGTKKVANPGNNPIYKLYAKKG